MDKARRDDILAFIIISGGQVRLSFLSQYLDIKQEELEELEEQHLIRIHEIPGDKIVMLGPRISEYFVERVLIEQNKWIKKLILRED